MIDDKYIISMAEAVESVRKVQNKINNEPYRNHSDLWSGADVRIKNINSSNENSYYPFRNDFLVITPDAKHLSWGFYEMREFLQ